MKQYLTLVDTILGPEYKDPPNGQYVITRSGPCLSIFDYKLEFDMHNGFPILTTKKLHFKSIVGELLWFLRGDTNIKYLHDNGISIWDEWADSEGNLGPIYGHQWRNLAIDQISWLINEIKTNPNSRRLIVNSWNVEQLDNMRLPPCHYAFECYVRGNVYLDLKWHQRSVDVALGLPFNIVSYALLLHILARECNLIPGKLIGDLGNCHIYTNHIEGLKEQLTREPLPLCSLQFDSKFWTDYTIEDFTLTDYRHREPISFIVSK